MTISHLGTAKDSIFVRPTPPDHLYKLKDEIQFHLYINTAPCGDARIFSPHENDTGVDKHPNRLVVLVIYSLIFSLIKYYVYSLRSEKHAVSYVLKSNLVKVQYPLKAAATTSKHGTV